MKQKYKMKPMKHFPEELKSLIENLKKQREVPLFVIFGGIQPTTLMKIRKELARKPDIGEEIDIILHSPGGSPGDAYRMIRAFRSKYKIVNIIVPFWAKSAATLFALGASRLVLHEFGELGPLDVQIPKDDERDSEGAFVSALNVQSSLSQIESRSRQVVMELFTKLRSSEEYKEFAKIGRKQLAEILFEYSSKFYTPLLEKIETIEIGTMARKLNIGKMYARRIINQYSNTPRDKAIELLDFLVYECPDHSYVIDYAILKDYLPSVIRSFEEPFDKNYDDCLCKLSEYLMEHSNLEEFVGFFNDKKENDSTDGNTDSVDNIKNEN